MHDNGRKAHGRGLSPQSRLLSYTPAGSSSAFASLDAPLARASITRACADVIRGDVAMSSVVKKRRKKMRKHKHRKMLKKTRWQRKHKG
jgi:mRNA-processing protein COX24